MSLIAAREAAERGQAQALGHAESVEPNWGSGALYVLQDWCRMLDQGCGFTSYDFITHYEAMGHVMPPTPKAFGPVFTKAARNGWIRNGGYLPHPLRHCSPTVRWIVT